MLDCKGNSMASLAQLRSPYTQRVDLVRDTITAHTDLDDDSAGALAVHILHALNSIPEIMR
jgi:hypothetical protein